jgi:hypothetical protein
LIPDYQDLVHASVLQHIFSLKVMLRASIPKTASDYTASRRPNATRKGLGPISAKPAISRVLKGIFAKATLARAKSSRLQAGVIPAQEEKMLGYFIDSLLARFSSQR